MTIRDIAKIAQVSHTTVSRVLNNNPDVNAKTREKILSIIEEYNYIPNDSARNLKLNDTKSIGLITNNINNPFLSKMTQEIEKKLQEQDYTVYFQIIASADGLASSALKLCKEKKLNGLIFVGGYSSISKVEFEMLSVPVVFTTINPGLNSEAVSSIYIDDIASAFMATDYLCKLGHKNIAIITSGSQTKSIGRDRLKGYLKALARHKILRNENLIKKAKSSSDIEAAYFLTKELIKQGDKCTAIFAVSDLFAIGVIRALKDAGLRVPEDVSVIGFDGIDLGNFLVPRLTTIQQPITKMAEQTVHTIIEMIEKDVSGEKKLFQTSLVVRESCKKLKKQKRIVDK